MAKRGVCAVEGCNKPIHVRQWCNAHYLRWRRHGDPTAGRKPQSALGEAVRWMVEHLDHDADECLIWPFGRTGSGYGAIYDGGSQKLAHRWVCLKVHGPAPTSRHEAGHTCGRGHDGCVHPKHLYWASPVENAQDRWAHGTQPHGEGAPNARLTEDQVVAIWGLRGVQTTEATAKQFGIAKGTVSWIWTGRSWSWLTGARNVGHRSRRRAQRVARIARRSAAA